MNTRLHTGRTVLAIIAALIGVLHWNHHSAYAAESYGVEAVRADDTQSWGNGASFAPSMSADGRYVAFGSFADNLVPGDTNDYRDIFVYDRDTRTVERVSVASDGRQGDQASFAPSISPDGRYVAFYSFARNLVPRDLNSLPDIFVHDRDTGTTEMVSVNGGQQARHSSVAPTFSADGQHIAFLVLNSGSPDNNIPPGIVVHDRATGAIDVVSPGIHGDDVEPAPVLSGDGRYVAFMSRKFTLVPVDTNGAADIFVYDRQRDRIERVSVASDGTQADARSAAPSISADGRYVAFFSLAANLVSNDNNYVADIFLHDRIQARTIRIDITQSGFPQPLHVASPTLSPDGRTVTFAAQLPHPVNALHGDWALFVYDQFENETTRVDTLDLMREVEMVVDELRGRHGVFSVSADNRSVAFAAGACSLIPRDTNRTTDVFVATVCDDAVCGDGIRTVGCEECDDGNVNNADSCRNDCTLPVATPTPTPTPTHTPTPTMTPTRTPTPTPFICRGDCDDNSIVTVDEVLVLINVALGHIPLTACLKGDGNFDGQVTVDEIVAGVATALNGCGNPDAVPTPVVANGQGNLGTLSATLPTGGLITVGEGLYNFVAPHSSFRGAVTLRANTPSPLLATGHNEALVQGVHIEIVGQQHGLIFDGVIFEGTGSEPAVQVKDSAHVTFRNCVIRGSTHGALLIENSRHITLQNCILHTVDGIGVDVQRSEHVHILNNVIANQEEVGLLLAGARNTQVVNNTIYGNEAGGVIAQSAIFGDEVIPTYGVVLQNNILAENGPLGISVAPDATAGYIADFNLVYGHTLNYEGIPPGAHDTPDAPFIIAPTAGDFRLYSTTTGVHSPAIDAGSNAIPYPLLHELRTFTARTDGQVDADGRLDLGFHYPQSLPGPVPTPAMQWGMIRVTGNIGTTGGTFAGHIQDPVECRAIEGITPAEFFVAEVEDLLSIGVTPHQHTGDPLHVQIFVNDALQAEQTAATPEESVSVTIPEVLP